MENIQLHLINLQYYTTDLIMKLSTEKLLLSNL